MCRADAPFVLEMLMKLVASVVAPKESGRRKCMQKRHVQEIALAAKWKMYSKS